MAQARMILRTLASPVGPSTSDDRTFDNLFCYRATFCFRLFICPQIVLRDLPSHAVQIGADASPGFADNAV